MKGKFITFEGCEGVGKSTQLQLLTDYLVKTGVDYLLTREPGGTPVSEKIREILLDKTLEMDAVTEAYLFASARAEHIKRVIIPALSEGKLVICDRFMDSSIAYQGFGRNLGTELVEKINETALFSIKPDATVFLNLSPENMWRKNFGDDRIEKAGLNFHKKVYEGFVSQLKKEERFINIIPQEDKYETSKSIIAALKEKGIIK